MTVYQTQIFHSRLASELSEVYGVGTAPGAASQNLASLLGRGGDPVQRVGEVLDDILGRLDADRQPDHIVASPARDPLLVGELSVGGRRRVEHQGPRKSGEMLLNIDHTVTKYRLPVETSHPPG